MATLNEIPKPNLIRVATAGETVPVGRLYVAKVCLVGAATFTLGGVAALVSTEHSVLASDNLRITTQSNGTTTSSNALFVGSDPASVSGAGTGFNENQAQQVLTQTYVLPEGTAFGGTGSWRAVIEEYYA